ncbi:MAG: hypothetical protein HY289_12840 [Planctomycetes bacterium]|nr:hypothetical protein [Planctomycetota bacterium]
MLQRIAMSMLVLVVASQTFASEKAKGVEIATIKNVVTVWSVGGKLHRHASHTFVITHGHNGVDARFFALGREVLAKNPGANVFVVDWSAGSKELLPQWTAPNIDKTGNALGTVLLKLSKNGCFDPAKATFIGESFGNYVNNRAAVAIGKKTRGQVQRALVLNPASRNGGYKLPNIATAFKQSVAHVTDSFCDTRDEIAHITVHLNPATKDPFQQHNFGMQSLQTKVAAGESIDSLFTRAALGQIAATNVKNVEQAVLRF